MLKCFKKKAQPKKVKDRLDDGIGSAYETNIENKGMFASTLMGQGKSKTECQDTHCVLDNLYPGFSYIAVYDGHGANGFLASKLANIGITEILKECAPLITKFKDGMPLNYKTEIARLQILLNSQFRRLQNKYKKDKVDYTQSGTCAVGVMVFPELLIALNLGDSRAILCNIEVEDGKAISKTAIELSTDHKPFRETEKERVLKCGGKIERAKGKYDDKEVGPLRVWLKDEESPGIAITRSIGDLIAHTIGVTCDPEITFRFREQGDKFIVLGSDGVWDVMSSAEAVGLVLNCETREESANKLVEECKVRWNLLNEVKLQQSRAILESSETNQKKITEKLEALKKSMVRDDITAIVMFL